MEPGMKFVIARAETLMPASSTRSGFTACSNGCRVQTSACSALVHRPLACPTGESVRWSPRHRSRSCESQSLPGTRMPRTARVDLPRFGGQVKWLRLPIPECIGIPLPPGKRNHGHPRASLLPPCDPYLPHATFVSAICSNSIGVRYPRLECNRWRL